MVLFPFHICQYYTAGAQRGDGRVALTLLGEEGLPVEGFHHRVPEAERQEVAEVALAAAGPLAVELRLDAEGTQPTGRAALEALHAVAFTFEESKFA